MLIFELFVQGLVQGSIYALIAVGLTLVYGLLRILHVAHAGLFTLGGYCGVLITNETGSLAFALLSAMLLVGIVGMGIYKLCYQPILGHPPFVALIASIGLFIAMEELYRLAFGPYGISFNQPPLPTSVDLLGMRLKLAEIITMLGAAILIGALALLSSRTRIGVAWRATVTEPEIAESFGINIEQVRYLNFFVGSALAAAAGVMVAVLNNLVEPTMGSVPSYKALAIIVLGGLGDVRGTLIAALALGVIEAYGTIYLGHLLDRDAIAFTFLIIVLMIRPQGLFGRAIS
jgi:branched-chain amino acid transport system permease protein